MPENENPHLRVLIANEKAWPSRTAGPRRNGARARGDRARDL